VDRNPAIVLEEIAQAREELKNYAAQYSVARKRAVKSELAYERAMAQEITRIYNDTQPKPPAEDIRKAMAHDRLREKEWENYLIDRAELDSLDRLLKTAAASLSSLQSELGQLRDELKFTS